MNNTYLTYITFDKNAITKVVVIISLLILLIAIPRFISNNHLIITLFSFLMFLPILFTKVFLNFFVKKSLVVFYPNKIEIKSYHNNYRRITYNLNEINSFQITYYRSQVVEISFLLNSNKKDSFCIESKKKNLTQVDTNFLVLKFEELINNYNCAPYVNHKINILPKKTIKVSDPSVSSVYFGNKNG